MREGLESWCEAAGGEHRRVDAARELAKIGECLCKFGAAGLQELKGRGVSDSGLKELQINGELDELLLGAVVEVAFESLARFDACFHDAFSGGA